MYRQFFWPKSKKFQKVVSSCVHGKHWTTKIPPKRVKQLALTFLPSLPSRLIRTWNHFLVCLSNFILLPLIFYSKPKTSHTEDPLILSLWLKPLNMYLKKVQGIFGPKGVLSNKIARVVKKGCLKKRNSMS